MNDLDEPAITGASRRHSIAGTRRGRLSPRLAAAAIALCLVGCPGPSQAASSFRVVQQDALASAVEQYKESLRKSIQLQKNNIENAKERHQKLKSMLSSQIVSAREVEAAERDLDRAKADLAKTQRELEWLERAGKFPNGETRGREVAPEADLAPSVDKGTIRGRSSVIHADSLPALAVSLSRITPRDEFESTAQHRSRLARALPTKRFTYLVDRSAVSVNYDADSEVMYVVLDATGSGTGPRSVVVDVDDRHLGSYVGSNAFGVKRRVTRQERRVYGVSVYPQNAGADSDAVVNWGCEMQVSRNKAKALKGAIGIALVGRVDSTNPGVVPLEAESTFHGATIDDPIDLTVKKFLVRFRVEELLVVNRQSGEVLRRFLLSNDEFIGIYTVAAP